jgi:endoglucanase
MAAVSGQNTPRNTSPNASQPHSPFAAVTRPQPVSSASSTTSHEGIARRLPWRHAAGRRSAAPSATRGISLGGLFEATPPGAWLCDAHLAELADARFTTVRLPVKWSAHAGTAAPYAIDPGFLAAVDHTVEAARAHGLTVIVDVHHYDELSADPEGHTERFLGLWRQLARRYPRDVRLELLNEPHDRLRGARWNALLAQALAVVRETAPEHTVIAGPAHRNVIAGLDELEAPQDDNLIVGVHYYLPFAFTHQGAPWLPGAEAWLGTEWDGEGAVVADIERAAAWGRAYGHEVVIGEFGALTRRRCRPAPPRRPVCGGPRSASA